MAYLARIEPQDSQPVELPARPANDVAEPGFSALEWSVIRFARLDKLWTVRAAGRVRKRAALFGTPLVVLAAAVTLWNSDPSPAAAPPAPLVTVAAPLQREVALWDDYVGRFEASRTVEVRPRAP